MGSTHTFKLTSGVKCTVKEMVGKHQRILTTQGKTDFGENLNLILEDIIVSIGSNTQIKAKDILELTSADREKILIEARHFTMGFPKDFSFDVDYTDSKGKKQKLPIEYNYEKLGEFPVTTMKITKGKDIVEASFKEYEEVINNKVVSIVLPRSNKNVEWTMLDGVGERIGANTKKSNRSSHTSIQMRRPVELVETKGDRPTKVQLDLDKLSFIDIEYLRESIYNYEGRVGTEIPYTHPVTEEDSYVDVLGSVAFFFPSGRI